MNTATPQLLLLSEIIWTKDIVAKKKVETLHY